MFKNDDSLKSFQRKIFLAFSVSIAIGVMIMVMLSTNASRRGKLAASIAESHQRIEHKLDTLIELEKQRK